MSRFAFGRIFLAALLLGTTGAAFQQILPALPARDGQQPAPAGTASIRGRVIDMASGAPLRRVQVVARPGDASNAANVAAAANQSSHTATTDDSGRFELTNLPAGRYQLSAAKGGFVTLQHGQRRPLEPGRPIVLAGGQAIADITFNLPRGSVITGRVLDPFGDTVTGANVQVHAYRYVNGRRQLTMAASGSPTDDRGVFRVFGLLPGDYYVSAGPPSDMLSAITALASGGSTGGIGAVQSAAQATSGYTRTYYPGTPSPASAQVVRVGVGEEAPPLTIALSTASLATISGTVLTPEGTPANASVMLRPRGSDPTQFFNSQMGMAMNGAFKIAGVVPGDYTLEAMVVDPLARPPRITHGMTDVVVTGDVSNVVISATPGITVRGRIAFGDGETPGTLQRTQVRLAATGDTLSLAAAASQSSIREDWGFEISGVTGARTVRASVPAPWTLSRVLRGSADITDTAVEFSEADDVTVVLTQRATELTGVVRDPKGATAADCVVLWFADDRARWTPQSRFIRTARPEPDGRYRVRALPAGPYFVIAVQYLEPGEEFDAERLEQLRRDAIRVDLREAETRTVDVKLSDL
jgi:hypothetical protein